MDEFDYSLDRVCRTTPVFGLKSSKACYTSGSPVPYDGHLVESVMNKRYVLKSYNARFYILVNSVVGYIIRTRGQFRACTAISHGDFPLGTEIKHRLVSSFSLPRFCPQSFLYGNLVFIFRFVTKCLIYLCRFISDGSNEELGGDL